MAVQWNLDLTKSLGTGQICSLNGGFVIMSISYKYIKQRDTSFEFSSILSTVDLSNHLIMVESFENSYSSSIL